MGYMCLSHFWFLQGICLEFKFLGNMVVSFLVFFKDSPCCLPYWLYQFTFPPTALADIFTLTCLSVLSEVTLVGTIIAF